MAWLPLCNATNVPIIERIWRKTTRYLLHGRTVLGFVILGLGFARLDPFAWFTFSPLRIGNQLGFGIALTLCGIGLIMTYTWRLTVKGKLITALAAAVMGALAYALWLSMPSSTAPNAVIILLLLVEAGAYE